MSNNIDIHILELLASKICHDLISPIGAINNGLEILEELGPDAGPDVTGLIAFSAAQASAKLQAYRMAYGAGGADSHIKPEDVYNAIEAIVAEEKKIVQNWDPHGPLGPDEYPTGFCKMLISALLLAMECLPKGGTISVNAGDNNGTIIRAEGENAGLREGTEEALNLKISSENMEPKFMHAYISGLLASHYNFTIMPGESGANFISFNLLSSKN